jgi:hypothetical protein
MAKKTLPPHLKAYSSCVKDLGLNPQKLKLESNKKRLKACATKKLRAMGIKPKR